MMSTILTGIFKMFGFACTTTYTVVWASVMQHQRTQSDSEAPCDVAKYISVVAVQCIESIQVYKA